MIRAAVLFVVLAAASTAAAAPTLLVTNGIPSFDTNLGTLISATVTLAPPVQQTSVYESGFFENVDNHAHLVNPLPIVVSGLDTYDFVPTLTSFVDPDTNEDHSHTINLLPIVEVYTGPDLAWFLDPANGVPGALPLVAPPTTMVEGHDHTINFLPVLPQTRFLYEPVPEPTSAMLIAAATGLYAIRRRR